MSIVIDGTGSITGIVTPVSATQGGTGVTSAGSAGNVLVSDGTSWSSASKITTGIAQNTTSGTSVDFTSIPSWAKRITVMFNGVSTNGTSLVQIQIGSGSFVTTGYLSSTTTNGATNTSTTGFLASNSNLAANARNGLMTLTSIEGNTWVMGATVGSATNCSTSQGVLSLGGALDRIRITTVNDTDTFDAGSVNIMYE